MILKDRGNISPEYSTKIAQLYGQKSIDKPLVREVTFQITNACNLDCDYCYEHHKENTSMPIEVGRKIVDLIIDMWEKDDKKALINKGTKTVILSFIGGEPLLEVNLIDQIIEYFFLECGRRHCSLLQLFRISISTNGQNFFDKDVQAFIKKYQPFLSLNVSIDGIKELHDAHRVDRNGNGSFDKAFEAFKAANPSGHRQTKMTFVPESFQYIFDSVKFMLDNGADFIACNYAYEPYYSIEDGKILYSQLKKLSDYLIETKENRMITMLDWNVGKPFNKQTDNHNWCGGTGNMLAFSPDGNAYPCLRYCPISIGKEKSNKIKIGDINGIYNTPLTVKIKDYLDSITLTSQSTEECINCPVASGCGWCSAYNYEVFGTPNKRVTNICNAHKARVLASYRYHNKRFLALHDDRPRIIHMPKEEALKFISLDEWNELKQDEQLAKEQCEKYGFGELIE